jgi:hypothetical protein
VISSPTKARGGQIPNADRVDSKHPLFTQQRQRVFGTCLGHWWKTRFIPHVGQRLGTSHLPAEKIVSYLLSEERRQREDAQEPSSAIAPSSCAGAGS